MLFNLKRFFPPHVQTLAIPAPPSIEAPLPEGIKIYTIEGQNMNIASIVTLISALLPVAEEIASHYIINPDSKHKLTVITGDLGTITQVAQAIALQSKAPVSPAPAVPAA